MVFQSEPHSGCRNRPRFKFSSQNCDPAGLVQCPNSRIPLKSIGEGASSVFGGGPGSPENVSCSRATPHLHRCNLGVALGRHFRDSRALLREDYLLLPLGIQEFRHCTRPAGSQSQNAIPNLSFKREWFFWAWGGRFFLGPLGPPKMGDVRGSVHGEFRGFRGSVPRGVPGTFGPRALECPNSVLSPRPEGPQKPCRTFPRTPPHFRGTLPETRPKTLQAQRARILEDSCTRLGGSQKL